MMCNLLVVKSSMAWTDVSKRWTLVVLVLLYGIFTITAAADVHRRTQDVPKNVASDVNLNSKNTVLPPINKAQTSTQAHSDSNVETENVVKCNSTLGAGANCTREDAEGISLFNQLKENKEMLMRTLYVTLGVTGIVVVYFVVRSVRLRRRRTKSRKYGIITQQGDRGDMEMEPLGDGNDDDDDYTVFEMNGRRK